MYGANLDKIINNVNVLDARCKISKNGYFNIKNVKGHTFGKWAVYKTVEDFEAYF